LENESNSKPNQWHDVYLDAKSKIIKGTVLTILDKSIASGKCYLKETCVHFLLFSDAPLMRIQSHHQS